MARLLPLLAFVFLATAVSAQQLFPKRTVLVTCGTMEAPGAHTIERSVEGLVFTAEEQKMIEANEKRERPELLGRKEETIAPLEVYPIDFFLLPLI